MQWAMTQNNMGNALLRLGEGESGMTQLEAAIATYNDALAVFVAASAIHYIEVCWENRDRAIALLAERRPRTEPTKPADAAVLLPSL